MKVYVNTKKVKLEKNYIINRGEYRANPLEFEFSNEYADLIKKVRFVNDEETIENTITNDTCYIPETMSSSKKFELRVYAYEMQGDDLILRYSPTYAKVFTREGSYQSDATPIEIEKLNIVPMQREQNFKGLYDEVNVQAIQSDELNITPSNEEQTFTGLYNTVSVEAIPPIEADTLNATSSTQNQSFSGLYDEVNIAGIQTDTLNVTPSQTQQQFTGLYDEVNVSAIDSDTLNITPSQTQQQFTGLYDTVNVGAIQAETLNVTPTKEAQTRTGLYNQVNVSGDNNLVAGNIKKNVSIFGVTGSYEETPNLQSKSITITENGTQTVSPDTGYDGLSSVAITTNVSGSGDEWYISNAKYLFYEGARLNEKDNLLPLVKNATDFRSMFNGCSSLTSLDLRALDTSSATSFSSMFMYCSQLQSIDLSSFDTSNVTGMSGMFGYCGNIDTIILGNKWDTSKATNMSNMFESCARFTGENIDWTKWNTTNLEDMYYMFSGCNALTTVPIFNTSKVNNMGRTFRNCSNLSNQSLNNILAMCIQATGVFTKTLKQVGLSQAQATTCQGLSNYQAFLDAGWTTGY